MEKAILCPLLIMICNSTVLILYFSNITKTSIETGILDDLSNVSLPSVLFSEAFGSGVEEENGRFALCTASQLETITYQLPPQDCVQTKAFPWRQKCSFSYATRCPEQIWLDEYYQSIHRANYSTRSIKPFVAFYVGCNKGMDAVNTLRMGSADPTFDKNRWKDELFGKRTNYVPGVCDQESTFQFPLEKYAEHDRQPASTSRREAEVHCIEPMPITAVELLRAAQGLGWDKKGFVVTQAALSNVDGIVRFPSAPMETGRHARVEVGTENKGISTCERVPKTDSCCEDVNMYKLDTFVDKFLKNDGPIHILSIDVEGYDFDVILGAKSKVLPRVQYLEFEYNWMGSWGRQSLKDAIEMLDSDFGFTCYWPGSQGKIWRITGCWLDYYDLHFWSNVACVNRNFEEVKSMATRMEELFLSTVEKGKSVHVSG